MQESSMVNNNTTSTFTEFVSILTGNSDFHSGSQDFTDEYNSPHFKI